MAYMQGLYKYVLCIICIKSYLKNYIIIKIWDPFPVNYEEFSSIFFPGAGARAGVYHVSTPRACEKGLRDGPGGRCMATNGVVCSKWCSVWPASAPALNFSQPEGCKKVQKKAPRRGPIH